MVSTYGTAKKTWEKRKINYEPSPPLSYQNLTASTDRSVIHNSLLSALMRYTMELRPTETEMSALRAPEENCAKHLSIVNDIYSFEKEVQAARTGHTEGSFLCSAVKVLATETGLGISATKRVLVCNYFLYCSIMNDFTADS